MSVLTKLQQITVKHNNTRQGLNFLLQSDVSYQRKVTTLTLLSQSPTQQNMMTVLIIATYPVSITHCIGIELFAKLDPMLGKVSSDSCQLLDPCFIQSCIAAMSCHVQLITATPTSLSTQLGQRVCQSYLSLDLSLHLLHFPPALLILPPGISRAVFSYLFFCHKMLIVKLTPKPKAKGQELTLFSPCHNHNHNHNNPHLNFPQERTQKLGMYA